MVEKIQYWSISGKCLFVHVEGGTNILYKNKINQDIAEFAVVTEFHHRLYKFLFLGLCIYEGTHFYSLVPPCLSRQNRMCTAENISLKFLGLLWIWQMSAAC